MVGRSQAGSEDKLLHNLGFCPFFPPRPFTGWRALLNSCFTGLDVYEQAACNHQHKHQCGSWKPGLGAGQRVAGLHFGKVTMEIIFLAVGMRLVLS